MKRLFPVIYVFSCLIAAQSFAGSATWNLNPTSGDWNTATNWTPNTVPNGPSDIAKFAGSSINRLKLSAATTEVSEIVFDPGARSFDIAADPSVTSANIKLTISGPGITNNSGATQNLTAGPAVSFTEGIIEFLNAASAGNGTVLTALGQIKKGAFPGSVISFYDTSTAETATVVAEGATNGIDADGGNVYFFDHATAANASFRAVGSVDFGGYGGEISFTDDSTAANANFTIEEGVNGGFAGEVSFSGNSTAETAQFTVSGDGLDVNFSGNATAADATFLIEKGQVTFDRTKSTAANALFIINGATSSGGSRGSVAFFDGGTAGNATLIANAGTNGGDGGFIWFDGDEKNTARIELFGNAMLSVYSGDGDISVGSVEGDGGIVLNTNTELNIGSNNLSTVFSGTIEEFNSGSLGKIGTGTLTLSGASTYTGGTTISSGALRVKNTTGSATGTGTVNVSGGILAGKGIISGSTTVGSGSGAGGSLQPGKGASSAITLTIQNSLTFKSDGTYTWKLNTQKAKADQVIANGVTIESGAQFTFNRIGNTKLTLGTVFTAISNTAATAISGTFANLPDGAVVTEGVNKLQVSYSGGDGNDLTLTVVP